jgi:hypothetical protein
VLTDRSHRAVAGLSMGGAQTLNLFGGRPRTAEDIRQLVLRIARDNGWGSLRVVGELRKFGIRNISRSTVANILREADLDSGPKRGEGTRSEPSGATRGIANHPSPSESQARGRKDAARPPREEFRALGSVARHRGRRSYPISESDQPRRQRPACSPHVELSHGVRVTKIRVPGSVRPGMLAATTERGLTARPSFGSGRGGDEHNGSMRAGTP